MLLQEEQEFRLVGGISIISKYMFIPTFLLLFTQWYMAIMYSPRVKQHGSH